MKNILLPEALSTEGEAMVAARCNILRSEGADEASLCKAVAEADGIVLRSKAKITRAVLERAPRLIVVSRTGAGIDNVDVEACTKQGVMVCNLPGINAATVAEHALTLMLALLKRIYTMDRAVRNGEWGIRNRNLPQDAAGKVVGVVGLGRIGLEVAKRCGALGMEVVGYDPYVTEARGVTSMELDEVVSRCDVLTLHLPDAPSTHHLMDGRRIGLMKPTAYLINTSRGGVVEQKALESALSSGAIAGAALDVFEEEPLGAGLLTGLDNVILTPHVAALTEQCGAAMTSEAVRQALMALDGETPPNVANARELEARR